MPELPNFYCTNTCAIEFESHDENSLVTEITTSQPFFKNVTTLRRSGWSLPAPV